jgi:hypothetical protein
MDFLPALPLMTLATAGAGNVTSFAADVFRGRPSFEEIQSFQGVMDKIGSKVGASMQRKSCPLASVDLIIDGEGLLGIFIFKAKCQCSNAKSAMLTLLRALPEAQQQAVQDTMRPFDYLDMLRVGKMKIVAGLRPFEEESSEEEEFIPYEYRKKVTMVEFLTSEDVAIVPRRNLLDGLVLAITNMAETLQSKPSQALRVTRALQRWVEDAQEMAAIAVLSLGASKLCYCHCVHEARREDLIQLSLVKKPTFLDVVRRSLALVEIAALPCPKVSPNNKFAFFKRCTQVLQIVNPEGGCEQKRLCPRERREVALLMGNAPKCDRCPSEKAACCFEWDKTYGRWTQYEINRPFGYTAAMTLAEDELTLCKKCALRCAVACQDCRKSDELDKSGECPCGGRAVASAPPGRPRTLMQNMNGFLVSLRGLQASELSISRCSPAEEAAEVAYEQDAKRRRVE